MTISLSVTLPTALHKTQIQTQPYKKKQRQRSAPTPHRLTSERTESVYRRLSDAGVRRTVGAIGASAVRGGGSLVAGNGRPLSLVYACRTTALSKRHLERPASASFLFSFAPSPFGNLGSLERKRSFAMCAPPRRV